MFLELFNIEGIFQKVAAKSILKRNICSEEFLVVDSQVSQGKIRSIFCRQKYLLQFIQDFTLALSL